MKKYKEWKKKQGYLINVPSGINNGYAQVDLMVCSKKDAIESANKGRKLIAKIDKIREKFGNG